MTTRRTYCLACLRAIGMCDECLSRRYYLRGDRRHSTRPRRGGDEAHPWQENAIRTMEDAVNED